MIKTRTYFAVLNEIKSFSKNPIWSKAHLRQLIITWQIVLTGMKRELVSGHLLSRRKLNYAQMSNDSRVLVAYITVHWSRR